MKDSHFISQLDKWQQTSKQNDAIDAELKRLNENRIRLAGHQKARASMWASKMKRKNGMEQF